MHSFYIFFGFNKLLNKQTGHFPVIIDSVVEIWRHCTFASNVKRTPILFRFNYWIDVVVWGSLFAEQ